MSSFRIDRQYVSFETAETQPVYAQAKPQQEKSSLDEELEKYGGDISKLYNEIYERLQGEHADQAEHMLSKAALEAQDIVTKARREAEQIVEQAKVDTAKALEERMLALESEFGARKQQEAAALCSLESELRSTYTKLLEDMHADVIGLVMEIVKKIIGIKLSQSDDVFMGMIRDALDRLKQTGAVVIRISPEDYLRYFGSSRDETELENGDFKVAIVEDPSFIQGDLVVESEGEMIDLSIDRQIDLIEKAFQN